MNYITGHWSFDPFLILAVVVAGWHEVGLRRLARRSRPERTRQRPQCVVGGDEFRRNQRADVGAVRVHELQHDHLAAERRHG